MENEIKELQAMKTWELTERTHSMMIVPGLWRFSQKGRERRHTEVQSKVGNERIP